jgi:hypothetical protein
MEPFIFLALFQQIMNMNLFLLVGWLVYGV